MNFNSLTDKAVATELGRRVKSLRLQRNVTQGHLSKATTLSLNSIKALEAGRGKLKTLIAVLRYLGALDHLNHFVPEVTISPLQLSKTQGKVRERASKNLTREVSKGDSSW